MDLSAGQSLSHYRLVEEIGRGGMGVVWKADDTKLGRQVAVKILPAGFSEDRQRLARFDREAKLLAALNHPNVAAIYGLEETEGTHFLVLELIPGQSLAETLKDGPLPVEEALDVCRQVAEGLEAAHEAGVIHRDLKPGNVRVTPDGKAKVLDFGLAKDLGGERRGGFSSGSTTDLSQSPTVAAGTQAGVILGTAPYMSPEQARGKRLDKRTDIWSFGCLLYECLTGKMAFTGETVPDIFSAILQGDPDWRALPDRTPPRVRELMERCLEKSPRNRLQAIGDARIEIERSLAGREWTTSGIRAAGDAKIGLRRPSWATLTAVALATLAIGLMAAWIFRPTPLGESKKLGRFEIGLIAKSSGATIEQHVPWLEAQTRQAVAISPDGSRVVYASDGRLHLRDLDGWEAEPIPGTEGAVNPFFSPDGRWVAFFAEGSLRKVPLEGGAAVTLCSGVQPFGASWGDNGRIVFAGEEGGPLLTVSAAGGEPQELTRPDREKGEYGYRLPAWLPGGQGVLLTVFQSRYFQNARIEAYSLQTGERRVVVENATNPLYLSPGYVLFARNGTLMALPFNPESLEAAGEPIGVLEGISHAVYMPGSGGNTGVAQFGVSRSGTLAYVPGNVFPEIPYQIVEVDREGTARSLPIEGGGYFFPRLSPDGRRLAVTKVHRESDIWLYDHLAGTLTRQTFDGRSYWPVWHPDGTALAIASRSESSGTNIFRLPLDGSGARERWTTTQATQHPSSWSANGGLLAIVEYKLEGYDWDIVLLTPEPGASPRPFLETSFIEAWPDISPDGKWLAYVSDETGRHEVYVRPLSGPERKVQVSVDGGVSPAWAASGRELFYRGGEGFKSMMAVSIRSGPDLLAGRPALLFDAESYQPTHPTRNYDVYPDGRRFVVVTYPDEEGWNQVLEEFSSGRIRVVLNFDEEIKQKFAGAE